MKVDFIPLKVLRRKSEGTLRIMFSISYFLFFTNLSEVVRDIETERERLKEIRERGILREIY
jgi:hypothetical protein